MSIVSILLKRRIYLANVYVGTIRRDIRIVRKQSRHIGSCSLGDGETEVTICDCVRLSAVLSGNTETDGLE